MPTEVPVQILAPLIIDTLGWRNAYPYTSGAQEYAFEVKSSGMTVRPGETLQVAGVVDGDALTLEALQSSVRPQFGDEDLSDATNRPALVGEANAIFRLRLRNHVVGRSDPRRGLSVDIDLSRVDTKKRSSRRHAQILERDGKFYVRDLNSTNGTYVNYQKVPPGRRQPLKHGDVLQFGKGGALLKFQWNA